MQFIKRLIQNHIWILLILSFASFLYFYKIASIPNGFYIDEAFPAYNAYSILKTGKDEYGKLLPIVFRFYGSYNPSLYTYLTVIPISIWGLNIFSARFMSAICSLGFSLLIYLFFLSSDLKDKKKIAIIGSVVAAFSPWIIFYGRIGYEVTLGLLLYALGSLFLLKSLKDIKNIVIGILFLSLSTYAAYAERFIVPLLILIFLLVFKKKILNTENKKFILKGILIGFLTQLPNIYLLFTPSFFPKTNEFASSALIIQASKLDVYLPHFLSSALSWVREFLSQYFEYFSPRSLFFIPDPDLQRSIPDLSVFYPWMIVPYFLGIFQIYLNHKKDFYKFLLLLLIISPIPASFTRDPFSTHRALPLSLGIIILIALGIYEIKKKLSNFKFIITTLLVVFISALFFWRSYFVFLPEERAVYWQYGFAELAKEIEKRPGVHFVIDQARIKPAYINLAFFLKYPPSDFQKTVDQSIKNNYYLATPFNDHYNFGQIETRNVDWQNDVYKKQILVGDEYTISEAQAKDHYLTKVFEIRDPINRVVFEGFETNPDKACNSNLNLRIYCK